MTALAACGDDISDLFAPAALLDEARVGLVKTKSYFSALFDAGTCAGTLMRVEFQPLTGPFLGLNG